MREVAPAGIPLPAPRRVAELSAALGGVTDRGVEARIVSRVVAPEDATREDELVLVTSPRVLARAATAPGVILCQAEVAPRCPEGSRWVHPHASFALAGLLAEPSPRGEGVHPTAWVHPSARLDAAASVGAFAVVHDGATIGAGTIVGEGAVVFGRVHVGDRVAIGPHAVLGRPGFGWAHGPAGAVARIPQLGGVVVEDDVEIGPHCTVDAGTLGPTILRRGVKLDAHVHVGHNVVVGEGTFVAAQAGFAGSVRVGRGVLVGGQAGVTDHAVIGDHARLGAKSGVIGDVPERTTVAGFPAIPRVSWLRAWARLLDRGGWSKR